MSFRKSFILNDMGNETGLCPFFKGNTPPVTCGTSCPLLRQHVTGSKIGPNCFARRAAARAGERKQGKTLPAACSKDKSYPAGCSKKVQVL